jgi:flagellin-specific chaperone FliS
MTTARDEMIEQLKREATLAKRAGKLDRVDDLLRELQDLIGWEEATAFKEKLDNIGQGGES